MPEKFLALCVKQYLRGYKGDAKILNQRLVIFIEYIHKTTFTLLG